MKTTSADWGAGSEDSPRVVLTWEARVSRLWRVSSFADLIHLVETDFHFIMDLVDGAAADRVVRVVFHEQAPCLVEEGRFLDPA